MSDAKESLTSLYIKVEEEDVGQRIDKFVSAKLNAYSRTRIQRFIDHELLEVNGEPIENSYKVCAGDAIILTPPPIENYDPKPENIPLDILYEDEDVIVINKPAGMVVHPAVGHWSGTLVHALLYHCGNSLSGIGGVRRPGIVHRLDKDTSGAMIVAKNDDAHQHLTAQLQSRTLTRIYHAFTSSMPKPQAGTIDAPIGRHPHARLKMAITNKNSREAITYYKVLEIFFNEFARVEFKLATGRTHQIRVHAAHKDFSLIGDPLYGAEPTKMHAALKRSEYNEASAEFIKNYPYQALHAHYLKFIHPKTGKEIECEAAEPPLFTELHTHLRGS